MEWNNYYQTSDELKDCPFCGFTPEYACTGNSQSKSRSVQVKCQGCQVQFKIAAIRQDNEWLLNIAKKKWNRRVGEID